MKRLPSWTRTPPWFLRRRVCRLPRRLLPRRLNRYPSLYISPYYRKLIQDGTATEQEREQLRAKAIEAFELGLRRAEDRETRFTLASLYEQAKQNEQALAHYKQLQKFLSWDDSIATKSYRERLKAAFTRLGHPELAEKETVKLAEISRKEAEERKKQEEQKRAEEEAKKKAAKKDDKAAGSAEVNIKPGEPSPPIKLDSGSATPISPQKTESKSGEKAPAGGSTSATQQKQDGSAKR